MKTIKDSVHDHIVVDGVARDLLDTPAVQRLRRISQLGTVSLVYPSANHTRFEHSLGVYHLACRVLDHLGIAGIEAERIKAAALLHDVGHGPFSHNLEPITHRLTGQYHDEVTELISHGRVADALWENDIDPTEVATLIEGEGRFGQLISGELDVDRMDYLVRDAHHTGVPYGTIDHGRLVRELTFVDGELVLDEGNVQTAESLLVARALMNPTVYNHGVARISKSMLRRAAEAIVEQTGIGGRQLARMDDHDFIATIRRSECTSVWSKRIDERRLFKRALWIEIDDVPEAIIDADRDRIRELEATIAEAVEVDEDLVILDVPDRPRMPESTTRVMVNGEVRSLADQSPLVDAIRSSHRAHWRLGVYSPASIRERVGQAAVRELGVDIDGPLINEYRDGLYATLDEFEDR